MDSPQPGLPVPLPSKRPSEMPDPCIKAAGYLMSYAVLAIEDVGKAVARLPESRGFWDYLRARMRKDFDDSAVLELLRDRGIRLNRGAQGDRVWFRLADCPYQIHLVARPRNAPTPEEVVGWSQHPLPAKDFLNEGPGVGKLFCMLDVDRAVFDLKTATLTLVTNAQSKWVYQGVKIIDEVILARPGSVVVLPLEPLPEEDESLFRGRMRLHPVTDDDAAQESETYTQEEGDDERGDEQAPGQ